VPESEPDPNLKAQVYEELGVTVMYDQNRRVVRLESRPQIAWAKEGAGGGTHKRRLADSTLGGHLSHRDPAF
jgi:hypothetical protein